GSEETPDGKVLGVSFTQFFDKGKLTLTGKVAGDKLLVSGFPDGKERTLAWNAKALGLYGQERIYADKKAKTGDKVEVVSFELALGMPITIRAVVKGME